MSIYALRPRFQGLLRPVARALHGAGVTANAVTMVAGVISIALGPVLALHPQSARLFLLVAAWLFLRMALNAIDGMPAREFGQWQRAGSDFRTWSLGRRTSLRSGVDG